MGPVLSRILGCGNPGVCSECSRPSSGLGTRNTGQNGILEKLHLFAQQSSDIPYCPVFWVPRPELGPNLSGTGPELVRTGPELVRIGPAQVPTWSPEYGTIRDVRRLLGEKM